MSEPLPPGWTTSRLGTLGIEVRGQISPEPGINYDLYSVPVFPTRSPEVIDGAEVKSGKREVQPGDVLLCKINPRINRVWVVANSEGRPQIASTEYLILRPYELRMNAFICWYLSSPQFRKWIELSVEGATGSHTRAKSGPILEQSIPVAPLAEQKKISDAIEEHFFRIGAVESAAQTALAKLDTLRRTVLTAAFSGRLVDQDPDDEPASVLLEQIAAERPQRRTRHAAQSTNQVPSLMSELLPPGWALSMVGEIFEIVGGSTPRTDNSDYWGGDIPWLTPDDLSQHNGIFVGEGRRSITEAGLKSSSIHMLPKNSVLFSSRAPIGYVAIASNSLCTNQGFKSLKPSEKILPKYVYWYLRHAVPEIREMGSGTTFKEISKKRMAVVPFVLAPANEQKRIVAAIEEHFSRIDAARASLERCLQRCSVLRRAVLAAAFSGRLVEQDPNDEPASALLERIAAEQPKRRTRKKSA